MNLSLLSPTSLFAAALWRRTAEAELLARAAAGERESIGVLFDRNRDRIIRLAFQVLRDREAAEDAAQEILVRAFQKMPSFRGESEFSTWLYRLALNHCLEIRRVAGRRAELALLQPEPAVSTENHASRIETRLALEHALDELPEVLRLALILREWHQLSYEEIAGVLHLPVGTVRSRLHDARRRFCLAWEAQKDG